jgi:hypothetical protein
MKQSKILGLLAPCLLGFAGCAQSDSEPPLTPASYTRPAPSTPRKSATRPAQKARSLPPEATEQSAASSSPVVTGTEGDDSRTAIALARCQREVRCNNVGEDREFVTEEDCITRLEPKTESELEASGCPRRIPPVPLGACMDAIRKGSCDSPWDLASIEECSKASLCSKP